MWANWMLPHWLLSESAIIGMLTIELVSRVHYNDYYGILYVLQLGERIRAACLAYPAWKEGHQPSFKPWLSKTVSDQLPDVSWFFLLHALWRCSWSVIDLGDVTKCFCHPCNTHRSVGEGVTKSCSSDENIGTHTQLYQDFHQLQQKDVL